MVRTNTAILPGADAAVVRIKETRRALASVAGWEWSLLRSESA